MHIYSVLDYFTGVNMSSDRSKEFEKIKKKADASV